MSGFLIIFSKTKSLSQVLFNRSLTRHISKMSKPKVLLTRPDIPKEGMEILKDKCDLQVYDQEKPIPKEDLIKMVAGKDGLLCMLTDPVDKDVIEAAGEQLKIIASMSVGYEHIDINECKARNIVVTNTPDVSADSVAEWTVVLMLAAGRYFLKAATCIAKGEWIYPWGPLWMCGDGLTDAVVGIIGMGQIGQRILKRVLPFGVKKVLYFDIFHPIKPAEKLGAIYTDMDDLLKNSDYVVCMMNLTEETRHSFCKQKFDLMKKTAVFVNTSRGGVVNQVDLYDALKNKTIRAAAIDVTEPEPLPKDHQLLTLENLIVTPHVGSAELSVRIKMAKLAAENIVNVVHGQKPVTPIKMP